MKRPPYSKLLFKLQEHRLKPGTSIYIHAGRDSWQIAQSRNRNAKFDTHLVLPDGEDPSFYRWPVKNNDVIVVQWGKNQPGDRIKRLLQSLFRDGADLAVTLRPDHSYDCYRPEATSHDGQHNIH